MSRKLVLLTALMIIVIGSTKAVAPEGRKTLDPASIQDLSDMTFVSVAHNPNVTDYSDEDEVYGLVKQALEQLKLGDPQNPLSNLIEPGDMVVLKPNLVGTERIAFEGCTRMPVLRPIIDLAVEAGASEVVIAEGPASPNLNDEVFYSTNITDLVDEMQLKHPDVPISYQNINNDNWTWVDLGQNSTFYGVHTSEELYSYGEIRMDQNSYYHATDNNGYNPHGYTPGLYAIANTIFEADVLINVPKMKVHMITGVTMSLKNLIGITVSDTGNATNQSPIKDIPHWNTSYSHRGEEKERIDTFENSVIWRVNADLHKIALYAGKNGNLRPTKQRKYLSVVDGIIGMEGPLIYDGTPDPRPTGAIVAGQDPVAVDIVGSRIMGFNYTVLYSLTNMAKISDHMIGTTEPTKICVLGTSLTKETFGEPYIPHMNYEDEHILPYKIRLQNFNPPEAEVIKTCPETPREGVETEVIISAENIELVAAWLRYSLDGAEPVIMKMVPNGETMIGNLGLLEGGRRVSYDVCLQDYFFNTEWSNKTSTFVGYFEVFSAFWDEVEYQITTISNSTATGFNFEQPESQLSFNITGPTGTTGFCKVTIPDHLLWGEFSIYKNGSLLVEDVDYTQTYNGTHSIFYITYVHSTHTIEIVSTEVISEFSLLLILPLLMIVSILVTTIHNISRRLRDIN